MVQDKNLEQPILLYDGDCGFCSTSIRWVQKNIRPKSEITPWQWADLKQLGTTKKRVMYEAIWIEPNGKIYGGAQAVALILMNAGWFWYPFGILLRIPPFRWLGHWIYRLVAINRHKLPGGTPTCAPQK